MHHNDKRGFLKAHDHFYIRVKTSIQFEATGIYTQYTPREAVLPTHIDLVRFEIKIKRIDL